MLLYHLGRRNARVDVTVFVPGDIDCIVALIALRRGVLDALALRSPRRHRSSLGAQERKILCCRLGRGNARGDYFVAVPGDNNCIVALAALRRKFRTRSLFGDPGGIGPLLARGKGKCSFAASDAGRLA